VSTSIHLVAWNVNHRGSRKPLPPETLDAIAALAPDVLVLTEFVDGRHHAEFKQGLRDLGLASLAISLGGPHQNQVLIAARAPMADDDLMPCPGYTEAATTNWLHRRFPTLGLEIVGLRAPTYLKAPERVGYWGQVERIARGARDRPAVFVGDFSSDPYHEPRSFVSSFLRLRSEGFHWPRSQGPWSYRHQETGATTRVDHAFACPGLQLTEARYLYSAGRLALAGEANGHDLPLSDHAALSIRVTVPDRSTAI
jgi:hypothetical protein